jgi:hypothetical protein
MAWALTIESVSCHPMTFGRTQNELDHEYKQVYCKRRGLLHVHNPDGKMRRSVTCVVQRLAGFQVPDPFSPRQCRL